jgi:hypothetical protein
MTLSSTLVNSPKNPFQSPATHQRVPDPAVMTVFMSLLLSNYSLLAERPASGADPGATIGAPHFTPERHARARPALA